MDRTASTNGVSVIIPVYNREKYIEECINSVLSQETDFPVEIICTDDGSTDKSCEIIKHLAVQQVARLNEKTLVLLEKPADCKTQGAGPTRNRGIAAAKYSYIAFLDSDDVFLSGHLHHLFHFLEEHSGFAGAVDQIYGFSSSIDKRWKINYLNKNVAELYSFFLNPFLNLDCLTIRRSILDGLDGLPFESTLLMAEDVDLFLRILEKHKIAILPEDGSAYREGEQRSTGGSAKQYEYAWQAMQRAVQRYPYPYWLVRKRKAAISFRLAYGGIAQRHYCKVLLRLLYAAVLDPLRAVKVLLRLE